MRGGCGPMSAAPRRANQTESNRTMDETLKLGLYLLPMVAIWAGYVAVGARYRLDPRWSVSAGFAYDSSPVKNSDRSIVLPLDRQYRYALGTQYELRKDLTLGAAYEYMDAGSAPVNQTGGALKGDLKGRLKSDAFHILALNMNWKF